MDEREDIDQYTSSNKDYQAASIIGIRLDTRETLNEIEAFLRGKRVINYKQTSEGGFTPIYGEVGRPKMNDEGIQTIMSWLTPLISPHTVQGNFKDDLYDNFICEMEIDLRVMLMTNLHYWEIKIEDYNSIADMIMLTSQAFFSRCIDNKERESYANTLRTVESNRLEKGGGFSLNPFKQRVGG